VNITKRIAHRLLRDVAGTSVEMANGPIADKMAEVIEQEMVEFESEHLADRIEGMLHDKGAFRDVLPMHLGQTKFRWIVRWDIKREIESFFMRGDPDGVDADDGQDIGSTTPPPLGDRRLRNNGKPVMGPGSDSPNSPIHVTKSNKEPRHS